MKKYIIYSIMAFILLIFVGWQIYHIFLKGIFSELEETSEVRKGASLAAGNVGLVIGKIKEEGKEKRREVQAYEIKAPVVVLKKEGIVRKDPFVPALPVERKVEAKKPKLLPEESKKLKLKDILKEKVIKEKKKEEEIVLPTLKVTGVVWGEAPARAIIEGNVYKVGERVKGAEIINISEEGVEVNYKGRRFKIGVYKGG